MKYMKYINMAVVALCIMLLCACSNSVNIRVSDEMAFRTFIVNSPVTRIINQSQVDIDYTESAETRMTLECNKEAMKWIRIVRAGSDLYITTEKPQNSLIHFKATLHVSAPSVKSFVTEGSGDLTLSNIDRDNEDFSVRSFGSGDIAIDNCTLLSLKIDSRGSGDISVDNLRTNYANLSTFGSGDLSIKKIETNTLIISTQGSGDVTVSNMKATDVEAKTFGSGDIRLEGSCTTLTKSAGGSGDIDDSRCNVRIR